MASRLMPPSRNLRSCAVTHMMRDITQALVKNLGVDADAVVIQINEAPLAHKMKGGKTFVERAAAAKK